MTPQLGVAVFPAYTRNGVGTSLLSVYLGAAATLFPAVSLGVHPANYSAIGLYTKFGFQQFATGGGGYLSMIRHLI